MQNSMEMWIAKFVVTHVWVCGFFATTNAKNVKQTKINNSRFVSRSLDHLSFASRTKLQYSSKTHSGECAHTHTHTPTAKYLWMKNELSHFSHCNFCAMEMSRSFAKHQPNARFLHQLNPWEISYGIMNNAPFTYEITIDEFSISSIDGFFFSLFCLRFEVSKRFPFVVTLALARSMCDSHAANDMHVRHINRKVMHTKKRAGKWNTKYCVETGDRQSPFNSVRFDRIFFKYANGMACSQYFAIKAMPSIQQNKHIFGIAMLNVRNLNCVHFFFVF